MTITGDPHQLVADHRTPPPTLTRDNGLYWCRIPRPLNYEMIPMHILVNGTDTEIVPGTTLDRLIETLGLTGQRLAVEVNEELVPRSRFPVYPLSVADKVEIIQAVGGG